MTKIRLHASFARGVGQDVRGRCGKDGTPDDSIGRNRGTPDDSIGRNRGTPDDSIGRNRGTPDDSIGRGGKKKNPAGDMLVMFGDLKDAGGNGPRRPGGESMGMGPDMMAAMFGLGPRDMPGSMVGGVPNKKSTNPFDALLGRQPKKDNNLNYQSKLSPEQLLARTSAKRVLADPAFKALPSAEREALTAVMSKGGPRAADSVALLIKNNRLDVLNATDSGGQTVLSNLARIAGSAHPLMAGDVLDDLAKPKKVEQGYAPTCTATSMQYEMAKERPAEYARLMAGLAVDGHVTMTGGAELSVDVGKAIASSDRRRDYRSDSEAVFQSAVMDYANGNATYDLDKFATVDGGKTYLGLFPNQIRDALGQLFGVHYETKEILNDDMARAELDVIASRERPNRPVLFDINMGSFNHNVSLESVTAKYVTYRDPSTGDVVAMTRAEFIKKLTSVHYAVD